METLQQFSKTKEIQAGMIAVLHLGTAVEFASTLHVHCIVLGINKRSNGKTAEGTVNSVPCKALSKVFRAKYVRTQS
jgi:hypothetical protein